MDSFPECNGTEAEIRKRPTFEDWCDTRIRGREDYAVIRLNVIYYGVMTNIFHYRQILIDVSKKNQGMAAADSPEFTEAQRIWWYYYGKINILRNMLLRFFDIPMPDWKTDVMPDRRRRARPITRWR